jgi:hypothetical protein
MIAPHPESSRKCRPSSDLRKNYIGLVNDKAEEQRAAESQAKADHGVTDYFRALVAAVRNRHGEAR